MPRSDSMRSDASASRSVRMIGMPPHTAASKSRSTPAFVAAAKISGAVLGEQRLVRGHDRLAVGERLQHQRPRRLKPTHQLDDDVDVGRGDDLIGIRRERDALRIGPLLVRDPHERAHQREPHAQPRFDLAARWRGEYERPRRQPDPGRAGRFAAHQTTAQPQGARWYDTSSISSSVGTFPRHPARCASRPIPRPPHRSTQ